jgi:hypothetical protein
MTGPIFRDISLSQVPRILGLCDRAPSSATAGCFDRYFWHYKLLDVSNARFQEAALLLALLHARPFEGNGYHGNLNILAWAKSGVRYWERLVRKNGSVDEVYPFENSFCATAFSACAAAETLLLLKEPGPYDALVRAGRFLIRNRNSEVANQMAGAALALQNIFLLTGDPVFRKGAENKIAALLKGQDKSGYFPEYGGFDIGYLSLTISCLARYQEKRKEDCLTEALLKACAFIGERLDHDARFDYSMTSRKTQYLFPFGFALLKQEGILDRINSGLSRNLILNPAWLDDRYCIHLSIDYLETFLTAAGCA